DLFASTAVTAVGDPRQAIYGWRGASADNMSRFSSDFTEVESLTLSTSWRNDRSILHVANRIAEGLTDSSESPLPARDGAGDGQVGIEISSGAHDPDFLTNGLRALTEWFATIPEGATKAVLCRKRAHFAAVAAALEAAGFAVIVHGSSGLLSDPFVADLRAVLTAAVDPWAGNELRRRISGRRLGLGAGPIAAGVGERIEVQRAIDQGPRTAADRALVADYRAAGLSREALDRLVALARALRTVRSGTGTISSIIRTAMAETGIDSDIWGLNDSLRNLHRSAVDSFLSA